MYKKGILSFVLICFFIVLLIPKSPHELYHTHIGNLIRPLLTKPWASSIAGRYCSTRLSALHIKGFVQRYNIDMSESTKPLSAFTSFNDFFTRSLIPSARPIDQDPMSLACPADCFVKVHCALKLDDFFPIKTVHFNLATCLNSHELAQKYLGGTLIICRLAPWHYHRFHFPCDGSASPLEKINGIYESVNPIAYCAGIQPLEVNERALIRLCTKKGSTLLIVPVGALFVGAINPTYQANRSYKKGDEMGYFSFGGSTIIIIAPKGALTVRPDILKASESGIETEVKIGQPIGNFIDVHYAA